ncbi:hypothetical protein [Halorhodospira halochloris]|uniref:hypothetical protein n=1 Tax=Halorhodospira halochloris TaxID=1052 RepID=UPI0013A5A1AD|nr:hypothetical protein [Halorhodospira halochloris]
MNPSLEASWRHPWRQDLHTGADGGVGEVLEVPVWNNNNPRTVARLPQGYPRSRAIWPIMIYAKAYIKSATFRRLPYSARIDS